MLFTKLNLSLVNTSNLENIFTEFFFLCYISYLKTIEGRYANYLLQNYYEAIKNGLYCNGRS